MQNEELLVVGDKVDLLGDQNRLYRTMIEDVSENRVFLVGVPRHGGVPMPLHIDDTLYMIFYRESGRFVTEMQVVRFDKIGDVRYTWLYQLTEPVKNQRREAFRVPIIFDASICEYTEGLEEKLSPFGTPEKKTPPAESADESAASPPESVAPPPESVAVVLDEVKSRDISLTGTALVTKNEYKVGEKYLLKLFINGPINGPKAGAPPFHTCATVKRVLPWRETGKSVVGFNFFGQTKDMSEHISKFVLEEQRRQLKQKRLIEN